MENNVRYIAMQFNSRFRDGYSSIFKVTQQCERTQLGDTASIFLHKCMCVCVRLQNSSLAVMVKMYMSRL